MMAILGVLVVAVFAAVLMFKFYAKRGQRTAVSVSGGVFAFVLVLVCGVLVFGPQGEAPAVAAPASAMAEKQPTAAPVTTTSPDGKWHDTALGDVAPEKPHDKLVNRGYHAYVPCRDAVERQLRSPSTAKFPWDADQTAMVGTDDTRYVVQGHVDAQNGYGAPVRAKWTCTAKYLGNGADVARDASWSVRVDIQSR